MLKQLKRSLESEKKDKKIFDIIIYGSTLKGKAIPGDVDIAVIFIEGNLRERLDRIQEIKSRLNRINVDIKQALLTELFSSSFLARTGLMMEGYSIFGKTAFCERLGFKAYSLFTYNLDGLTHTEKIKFNYILSGRQGKKGIMDNFGALRLASGALKVPISKSIEFEEILNENNVKYLKKDILEMM